MIKGHTDVIGEGYNQELSLARANDVKTIIQNSLSKAGRNDVV
jgi:outer membrane protein OmpA-like peptidoglycan-associated protein